MPQITHTLSSSNVYVIIVQRIRYHCPTHTLSLPNAYVIIAQRIRYHRPTHTLSFSNGCVWSNPSMRILFFTLSTHRISPSQFPFPLAAVSDRLCQPMILVSACQQADNKVCRTGIALYLLSQCVDMRSSGRR